MIETGACILFVIFIVGSFLWMFFSEGETYTFGGANVHGILVNEYTGKDGYDSANGCYIVVTGAHSRMVKELPEKRLPKIRVNDYGGYEEI